MSLERKDEHDHEAWMESKELSPIEEVYLTTLIWLDRRLRIVDYLELLEDMYYKTNLQMPKSHTEQYNLDNKFWYWYPLYALGSFSTIAYVVASISGALLGFYYAPSTSTIGGDTLRTVAYSNVLFIMGDLNFGLFLRSLHRWSAQVMTAADQRWRLRRNSPKFRSPIMNSTFEYATVRRVSPPMVLVDGA